MSYVMGLYHQLINHRGLQPRFFKIGEAKRMWKKFPHLVYAELISGEMGATFKMKLFGKEKFILAYAQTNDMKIQWLVSATAAKEPKEQHKLQLRVRREKYVESKAKLAQNIRSLNIILSHYLNSPLNQGVDNDSNLPENMKIPRKEKSSESNNETLAVTQNNDYEGGGNEEKPVKQNKGIKPVANKEKEREVENEKQSIKEEKQPVKQNKGANREIKLVKQNHESEERGEDEIKPVTNKEENEKPSVKRPVKQNQESERGKDMKRIQAQANAKTNMKKIQAQYNEPQLPDPYENDVNAKNAKMDEPQFPDPEELTMYHKPKIVKRQTQKKPVSYIKKKPIGSPTYN